MPIVGFFRKRAVILIVVLVLAGIAFLAFDVRLRIRRYTIPTDKVTREIRILLITDLHSCKYGEREEELLQAIAREKPDLLLLGGDIYDDVLPDANVRYFLEGIEGKHPCYYVTGNHEYWSGRIKKILELFRSHGVNILQGESALVRLGDQELFLGGLDDPSASWYIRNSPDVKEQLEHISQEIPQGKYRILLAHRPESIDLYAKYPFDLVLAGHAHGGQWRIPGLINGVFAPNQGWFPKYAGGKYQVEDTAMIVSRGLARESTRIPRIFNPPELVVITLVPSS